MWALTNMLEYTPPKRIPAQNLYIASVIVERIKIRHKIMNCSYVLGQLGKNSEMLAENYISFALKFDNFYWRRSQKFFREFKRKVDEDYQGKLAKHRRTNGIINLVRFLSVKGRQNVGFSLNLIKLFSLRMKKKDTQIMVSGRIYKLVNRYCLNHGFTPSFS